MGLKICWGKEIPKQLRAQGIFLDDQGVVGDSELETQFLENQLNIWLMSQNIPKD